MVTSQTPIIAPVDDCQMLQRVRSKVEAGLQLQVQTDALMAQSKDMLDEAEGIMEELERSSLFTR